MKKPGSIRIGNRLIGPKWPVFIIAEAGVNHNGRLDIALKLIDAAAKAGADAVKFQTFKAEQVVTASGKMAGYQKRNLGASESQLAMLRKLELPGKYYPKLINYAHKKKILFLSTPHGGIDSVDFLESLKVPAYKFGSGDLTNLPLLKKAAHFGKPLILGTGMSTLGEVREALEAIHSARNNNVIVLHCTTNYPCLPSEANLRAMTTLGEKLNVLVGYSDHTLGSQTAIMAVTLGACVIEKHLTLDTHMRGPDHRASMTPREFKVMVDAIREASTILGSELKKPVKSEYQFRVQIRKSLVAATTIKKGTKITERDVVIKRPGSGVEPKFLDLVLGKRAKRDIQRDTLLRLDMVE